MNDKQLLEMAAKAAGVKYDPNKSIPHPVSGTWWGLWLIYDREPNEFDRSYWNPLIDDGDALRLSVKLDIQIWRRPSGVEGVHKGSVLTNPQTETLTPDPFAATRRAIVRAAADVGKGLLTQEEFMSMFPGRFPE